MELQEQTQGIETADWYRLVSRHEEFLKILKLLVDFDSRTGMAARYADQQAHYMRNAIAVAEPPLVTVFLRRDSPNLFSIVAQMECDSGFLATAFVLEDGINKERAAQPSNHPVHNITCMTDLYDNACEPAKRLDDLNPIFRKLLNEG